MSGAVSSDDPHRSDVRALFHAALEALIPRLKDAEARAADDVTRAHLSECVRMAQSALEASPKLTPAQ